MAVKKSYFEVVVGGVVVLLSVIFVSFAMKLTNKKINREFYSLYASFDNIEGISVGTKVKIGGIEIGSVEELSIDNNYKIVITLKIKKGVDIPADSNIKISTSGLIGGKYLRVEAGGDDSFLKNGDSFEFTESTMDLEDMITKFMLNKVSTKDKDDGK
ncbi:MAG: outer membrane lipid asymmetry maintenance protein MlaD [Rickettsiales bacterium]|jgi:phospholipid/cholesterol/gamma-HCH transport system substrate-binding protein|nr:outer membrane lipid asymmetry maintenance protein MlaD [Rickettsiales bacterium]